MKRVMAIVTCLVSVGWPIIAYPGAAFTGNELHNLCNQTSRPLLTGFVVGVSEKAQLDLASAAGYFLALGKKQLSVQDVAYLGLVSNYCTRDNVTFGQLGDVVCKYLTENPAERDKAAADLVMDALHAAFPCPVK
jgi:Rap1a immunity proteins